MNFKIETKNLVKGEKILLLGILFLIISFSGGCLNMTALKFNEGKMPVQGVFISSNSPTHFSFKDKSEVNGYIITDIIPIRNWMFSIGDFLLIGGGIGYTISMILFLKNLKVRKKRYWEFGV